MQKMVVGFMFDDSREKVLLIEKTNPEWQRGKLNGVGGKLEPGEKPIDAMRREFLEETGMITSLWFPYCVLEQDDCQWSVHFFWTSGDITKAMFVEKEQPLIVEVRNLPANVVPNLRWLVPMALDPRTNETFFDVKV